MKKRIVFLGVILLCVCAAAFACADPTGNSLINAPEEVTWYTGIPWGGNGGMHSMSAVGQLWFPDEERDSNDLDIVWSLTRESGPDNFKLYHNPDSDYPESYFNALVQPKSDQMSTGTSVYTMRAIYKNATYEGEITIHTVDTGMPTGVTFRVFETSGCDIGTEVPFTNNTLTVESGKKYWISGLFTGGTAAPTNQWINNSYDWRGAEPGDRWDWGSLPAYGIYSSNTVMFTATTPGTYQAEADLSIGLSNLAWNMPFTMQVTDSGTSDPYFPEPEISIQSEYYADEEVLISLPWVSGAEEHEIRIFNMDGTDAYDWANVHWGKDDIPVSSCCFQVNVDAGPGQNRLMDPGDYYTVITVKGPGYRDTTFRRDFTILSENSHSGPHGNPNGLENGDSTWTWYTGLGGEWPYSGGLGSETEFIQLRIRQEYWKDNEADAPAWTVTNNHDSAAGYYDFTFEPEEWTDNRGIYLKPTWNSSDESVTGTNTYSVKAVYDGKTYESTETVRFVHDSYPTGMTMTVHEADLSTNTTGAAVPLTDGAFTLEKGKDYVFTSSYTGPVPATNMPFFMNSGIGGGLEEYGRYSDRFMTNNVCVWSDNQQVFAAVKPGVYDFETSLTIGMSNLVTMRHYTIRIADENGNVPDVKLELQTNETVQNVYLGLPHYGSGLGYDSTGVWGEKGRARIFFENYAELEDMYGGEPCWEVVRKDGEPDEAGSWQIYESDGKGWLEFELADVPETTGTVEYEVACAWGPKRDTISWSVNYRQLSVVPEGLDLDEVTEDLSIGDTLTIEPGALPAGATIPGYPWRIYVFNEQLEEFATLTDSSPTKREYTIDKAGVYNATILLTADTVHVGKEVIFRIKDADGTVPKPGIRVGTWNDFERNIYLVPNCTPGANAYGRVISDDFIDRLYFDNDTVLSHELNGDPVWSITENGGTAANAGLRTENGRETLYLKSMPGSAGDRTYDISCAWDGKTWTGQYTVHFISTALPTGVYFTPESRILILKPGEYFMYDIGFRNWEQPEGEEAWRDLSDSLRDAVTNWAYAPDTPGVYEGYMETGCANLMWREKLTIVVTEADGTMSMDDYRPFGTVTVLPGNITRIESEAFAGTKITEADIPAGTEIAEDAFDGSGLIAVYTHNDENTILWALRNGIVALTE